MLALLATSYQLLLLSVIVYEGAFLAVSKANFRDHRPKKMKLPK